MLKHLAILDFGSYIVSYVSSFIEKLFSIHMNQIINQFFGVLCFVLGCSCVCESYHAYNLICNTFDSRHIIL